VMIKSCAVLLPQTLPEEYRVLFANYLQTHKGQNFLFCSQVEQDGAFLSMEILSPDTDKEDWNVRIPLPFVLAIVEQDASGNSPIGFLHT
jgi:hypothetical protein